jgi:hypothetical protein
MLKRTTHQTMIERMEQIEIHPASYRDPDGFIFWHNKELYRQVNKSYAADYLLLLESGLYRRLTEKNWLVSHETINENFTGSEDWFVTLNPYRIPFVSYPYEWSFDMLRDAALLTLDINKEAMESGMILKDATPFNIQFHQGRAIFIDTLSFEIYEQRNPWKAYKQFCECFLFPLLLAAYTKTPWQKMLAVYPDGIPVETTAATLPFRSRGNLNVWLHVFLQANIRNRQNKISALGDQKFGFSKTKMTTLLNGLYSFIAGLQYKQKQVWDDYYAATILGDGYLQEKENIFKSFVEGLTIQTAIDIGTNDGHFAHIIAGKAQLVLAIDSTPNCINQLYLTQKEKGPKNILPLLVDIANPSAAIGFRNQERESFLSRVTADLVVALALTHHLHFSNNVGLHKQADLYSSLTRKFLIIEFISVDDEKVKIIVNREEGEMHRYDIGYFEEVFAVRFLIHRKHLLKNGRALYLMEKKTNY